MRCAATLVADTDCSLRSQQELPSTDYDENVCASGTSFAWVMARRFSLNSRSAFKKLPGTRLGGQVSPRLGRFAKSILSIPIFVGLSLGSSQPTRSNVGQPPHAHGPLEAPPISHRIEGIALHNLERRRDSLALRELPHL